MKINLYRPLFRLFFLSITGCFLACSENKSEKLQELGEVELSYASGFTIVKGNNYWEVEVTSAWTGADRTFKYLVLGENAEKPDGNFDATVQLPIRRIVLTSTTQIPHLDLLDQMNLLVGFPNHSLISSEKAWMQIDAGAVEDLGDGPAANTEMVIDIGPDLVMVSTTGEDLKYLDLLAQAGIPAVINGEYVEQHPLGRAEWIKFTGVLLGKYGEAKAAFEKIEKEYLEAEKLTENLVDSLRPTVLSGVLYQDIWYAPGSESWGAEILQNAGGDYIFSDQKGTGSVQLNYEYVLENAQEADFWIGSADFSDLKTMGSTEPRYKAFRAFQSGNVFSYTQKRGREGGLEYFELGYIRPDLIVKDLIKILHPDLLPGMNCIFISNLMKSTSPFLLLLAAFALLILSFLLNVSLGSVSISPGEILTGIFSGEWTKASREQIILNYRIPKALVAILAGVGLSVSGLQMQTFFRNPLAGPFVLGISSGAGLGVAILMLTGSAFGTAAFGGGVNPWAIAIAGTLGAGLVLLTVSLVAWKVKDSMTLLIVGLMFGSAVSAIISVLSYFSGAEALKLFTIWSMGSLGGLVWDQVGVLSLVIVTGIIPVIASVKPYNGMLLGESYAKSMGINPDRLRWLMILSTGLLAGSITAFCGPIAFIGIAVPHLARVVWKTSDHRILFPATALIGASLLLLCDAVGQLPGSAQTLPINAVTSLVGAPIVISLVLRKNFSKEF